MLILIFLSYISTTNIEQFLTENPSRVENYPQLNYKISHNVIYREGLFLKSEDYLLTENSNYNGKNLGGYTGEFLISAIPSTISSLYVAALMLTSEEYFEKEYVIKYIVLNSTLTPIFTLIAADIFEQKGSFWKSIAGATIGSFTGWGIAYWNYYHGGDNIILYGLYFVLPPLGATIGYNL